MNKINKIFNTIRYFGIKMGILELISKLFKGDTKFSHKLHHYKHEYVKKILRKKYYYIIEEFKNKKIENIGKIKKDSIIWVFWWQGLEDSPQIVKKCINSIIKNANSHKVIIVDKNNYKNYTNIPSYIIDKVDKGEITLTSFSDIVRMDLLYNNGGIWMDATIFMTGKLNDNIYNYELYTIKHNLYSDWHVCKGKWTGFFLAANKGNQAIEFFRKFFFEYLKNEKTFITYFLIDCIISIGYEDIKYIETMIDSIPINGEKVFELAKVMSCEYEKNKYNKIIEKNNIHKLSYKDKYSLQNNGKNTIYQYIMEE